MACSFAAVSKAAALFTRQPRLAATPVATMTAMGVAKPMAHGQAIINTAIPNFMAKRNLSESWTSSSTAMMPPPMPPCMWWPCGTRTVPENTKADQITKVTRERPTTEGTKMRATMSAMRWTSALLACASCTSATIWPSMVSPPTLVTLIKQPPEMQVEPPTTRSPCFLTSGELSPVSKLSSTCTALSEHTEPSTGILPPANILKTSSNSTSSTGIVLSALLPLLHSVAFAGMLEGRSVKAFMAVCFALDSRYFPNKTTAMRIGPIVKKWLVAMTKSCVPGVSGINKQYKTRPVE
mmetsp:Transcript_77186/g.221057  ORF Transcript_77186/g.221057 Transcript_77186/m.221057 type:complete len:295 (-) Transcript_77186:742-1626(-)